MLLPPVHGVPCLWVPPSSFPSFEDAQSWQAIDHLVPLLWKFCFFEVPFLFLFHGVASLTCADLQVKPPQPFFTFFFPECFPHVVLFGIHRIPAAALLVAIKSRGPTPPLFPSPLCLCCCAALWCGPHAFLLWSTNGWWHSADAPPSFSGGSLFKHKPRLPLYAAKHPSPFSRGVKPFFNLPLPRDRRIAFLSNVGDLCAPNFHFFSFF